MRIRLHANRHLVREVRNHLGLTVSEREVWITVFARRSLRYRMKCRRLSIAVPNHTKSRSSRTASRIITRSIMRPAQSIIGSR